MNYVCFSQTEFWKRFYATILTLKSESLYQVNIHNCVFLASSITCAHEFFRTQILSVNFGKTGLKRNLLHVSVSIFSRISDICSLRDRLSESTRQRVSVVGLYILQFQFVFLRAAL